MAIREFERFDFRGKPSELSVAGVPYELTSLRCVQQPPDFSSLTLHRLLFKLWRHGLYL